MAAPLKSPGPFAMKARRCSGEVGLVCRASKHGEGPEDSGGALSDLSDLVLEQSAHWADKRREVRGAFDRLEVDPRQRLRSDFGFPVREDPGDQRVGTTVQEVLDEREHDGGPLLLASVQEGLQIGHGRFDVDPRVRSELQRVGRFPPRQHVFLAEGRDGGLEFIG